MYRDVHVHVAVHVAGSDSFEWTIQGIAQSLVLSTCIGIRIISMPVYLLECMLSFILYGQGTYMYMYMCLDQIGNLHNFPKMYLNFNKEDYVSPSIATLFTFHLQTAQGRRQDHHAL